MPNSWFNGYDNDDDRPNDGVVDSIDWTKVGRKYFQVEVEGHLYSMQYDTIFLYVDDTRRNFRQFHVPRRPVPNPEGDRVHVPNRGRRSSSEEGNTSDTASSTHDNSDSEEGNTGGGGNIEFSNVYESTDPTDWTCIEEGDGQVLSERMRGGLAVL